jgi:predicted acylesterase/phospholipase RssA
MLNSRRLGLALSGGGFRASFFHLGVLRRLAELDLLRHVATLSTVSGGSILGTHYYLYLKRYYEDRNGNLSRDDYVQLVAELERDFRRGNRKDLRNRLFMNVRAQFRALARGRSYGRPMSRLYERHFYHRISRAMYGKKLPRRGLALFQAIMELPRPNGAPPRRELDPAAMAKVFPSSGYPNPASETGKRLTELNRKASSRIPHLVINATCLNTGGRFTFMLNEVGGPNIGYIRVDEVFMLLQYKSLLESLQTSSFDAQRYEMASAAAVQAGLRKQKSMPDLPPTAFSAERGFPDYTAEHVRFYLDARRLVDRDTAQQWPPKWKARRQAVRDLLRAKSRDAVAALMIVDFGRLRAAKDAAWWLLDSPGGDADRRQYEEQFWYALWSIHPELKDLFSTGDRVSPETAALILDLYYMRSAELIDEDAPIGLNDLTLSRAVAASANFPPVFTPLKLYDLFEQTKFDYVSLTDGGVHDNQGIEAVAEDGCEYIIVSDAGGLVGIDPDPADSRIPMMDRVINILMGGVREIQVRSVERSPAVRKLLPSANAGHDEFAELRRLYSFTDSCAFHITTAASSDATPLPARFHSPSVAMIRTDLDAFNGVEIAVLEYEGYRLADAHVRRLTEGHRAPFPGKTLPATLPPHLPKPARAERILRGSARRVGRFTEAYPMFAALGTSFAAWLSWIASLVTFNHLHDLWWIDLAAPVRRRINVIDMLRRSTDLAQMQLAEFMERLPAVRVAHGIATVQHDVGRWAAAQSIVALCFIFWTAYIVYRSFRVSPPRRLQRLMPKWLVRGARYLAKSFVTPLRRVTLGVSLVCTGAFIVTLRTPWLLGIVPLWSIPIALVFLAVNVIFTTLWKIAGWIPAGLSRRALDALFRVLGL